MKEIYLLTTDGYRDSLYLEKYATSYEELEAIARFYIDDVYAIPKEQVVSVSVDRIGKKIHIKYDESRFVSEDTFEFIVIKPFNDRT